MNPASIANDGDPIGSDNVVIPTSPQTDIIERMAREQGVQPLKRVEDLYADFWPEDESIDEFIATLRKWRREDGTKQ